MKISKVDRTKCSFWHFKGHFRLLRDRRNTLEACQCKSVFCSCQAQHSVSVLKIGGNFAKFIRLGVL